MAQAIEQLLLGTWRHSHEEDTPAHMVYRPENYAFPPARGRTGFVFQANNTCISLGISPRDGTARETCRWELVPGSPPQLNIIWPNGRRETRRVISVDPQRLVLSPPL